MYRQTCRLGPLLLGYPKSRPYLHELVVGWTAASSAPRSNGRHLTPPTPKSAYRFRCRRATAVTCGSAVQFPSTLILSLG